ncbi:MAG TPA: nucleoside phosphorylase [Flavobacteriaceae bacterium]|nr:nucleoside phosphorylase [Flavobacteriaceae bacterium]
MIKIAESELILTPEGKIYHLDLAPSQLADTVITVGDPGRVEMVSKYFDTIETTAAHREFITHTGRYKGKRISVISTGIGPDNIDIVFNELDALVNIDFETRMIKDEKRSLRIIRIGTSGGLIPEVEVDKFLISTHGIGLDNVMYFYGQSEDVIDRQFSDAFKEHIGWNPRNSDPYVVQADKDLVSLFQSEKTISGATITNVGFYGPQGRVLRLPLYDEEMNEKLASFSFHGHRITNLEMETSAMYGLAELLGHQTVSLNAIIANRSTGTFSVDPKAAVDRLIQYALDKLVS